MRESENETYWPGYVDALSNMVLALIFVVLVLALALSQYSAMAARQLAALSLSLSLCGPESYGSTHREHVPYAWLSRLGLCQGARQAQGGHGRARRAGHQAL